MRLTAIEWSENLRACLSVKRYEELGALNRREAFSKHNSPLYFVELLKFVQRCGQYETADISTQSISSAMNVVNKYRVDAHAKNISDKDYKELTISLDLLENIFVPPA